MRFFATFLEGNKNMKGGHSKKSRFLVGFFLLILTGARMGAANVKCVEPDNTLVVVVYYFYLLLLLLLLLHCW